MPIYIVVQHDVANKNVKIVPRFWTTAIFTDNQIFPGVQTY
jgi:hypothetical protein